MKNHVLIVSIASLGAFSLLVTSGFAVWVFSEDFNLNENEIRTVSTLSVASRAQMGRLTLNEPENYDDYRLIFDQGGSHEEDIASLYKGVYLNTPLSFSYDEFSGVASVENLYCKASLSSGVIDDYAELIIVEGDYQRIDLGLRFDGSSSIDFSIEPLFKYKEGAKPSTSSEWTALMKALENQTITLNLEFVVGQ